MPQAPAWNPCTGAAHRCRWPDWLLMDAGHDSVAELLGAEAAGWWRDRRRAGAPEDSREWARSEAGAVSRGLVVRVWLRCCGGRVQEVRYQVFGAPAALACAAWMADRLEGRPAVAQSVPAGREAAACLDLAPEAAGTALVLEDAFRAALAMESPVVKP